MTMDAPHDFESAIPQYPVRVDTFEGPLDLLVHLIRRHEVDIYDIPIVLITEQYLEYLELMQELDLDVAGEFLVMAATLIQIKSRMLVPRLETAGEDEEAGKMIAMHVAAARPQSLSVDDLPSAVRDRERQVLTLQARETGRPEFVIEKMVEGRMRKFYESVALLRQKYVFDTDLSVEDFLVRSGLRIAGFACFEVGEGIEKPAEDFAAEVAKVAASG